MKKRKHKIWFELVAKKETNMGAIGIKKSIKTGNDIVKVAEKNGFTAYCMGLPTEVIEYEPTGKTIQISSLFDAVEKLTPQQFEMFIIHFRKWVESAREMILMNENKEELNEFMGNFGATINTEGNLQHCKDGMTWLDTGNHKTKTVVEFER